jgi:hypothetical protein
LNPEANINNTIQNHVPSSIKHSATPLMLKEAIAVYSENKTGNDK